jgi:hypothetical protein
MPIYQKVFNSPYDKDHAPNKYKKQEDSGNYPTKPDSRDKDYTKENAMNENKFKNMLPSGQNKVVDLQVYQPPPPKGPNPYTGKKPFMPVEPIALTTPYVPPQYQSYVNNMMKDFYTPFIYKDYNIQIGAPNADHNATYNLFEDMTMPQEYYTSYKTLKDRKNLTGYIRGNFISNKNGENIDFSGRDNSLNSRLNFLSINPYTSNGSANPYKNMLHNLLLYTSCYPITKNDGQTMCSKYSVGINIRVHGLTLIECISQYISSNEFKSLLKGTDNTIGQIINNFDKARGINVNTTDQNELTLFQEYDKFNYDTWRENYYYDFIKNSICSNNVCPNFIQSYCYFQTINPDIKFPDNKNNLTTIDKPVKYSNDIASAISILTESPDYSVRGWGSNVQTNKSGIVTMTHSGYKLPILWINILQQMMISFYVMFKYKFVMREMSLSNTFFIKVVDRSILTFSVWKYNIKGINYYVRNYGNLLLVDAGSENVIDNENVNKHKILMNTLKNYDEGDTDNNLRAIYKVLFENMKKIFNPTTFNGESSNDRGTTNRFMGVNEGEDKDIWDKKITMINDLINNSTINFNKTNDIRIIENDFDDLFDQLLIHTLMDCTHNRIGTHLRDTEVAYINKDYFVQPKRGDIIVYETEYDSHIFVLFIGPGKNPETYRCITKQGDKFRIDEDIKKDLTSSYLESKTLKFDMKEGEPVSNNDEVIDDTFSI